MRLLVLLIFLPFSLQGLSTDTTRIVSGKVFDVQTGEALPGANIIYGEGRGVITSLDGSFSFQSSENSFILTVRFIGYKSYTRNVIPADTGFLFFNIGLERLYTEIEQIVISAGKTEQRLSDLTVSMSLIKPEDILRIPVSDAEELIDRSPGIEILDGQASVRGGSGFSYGAGSRVLALTDGLPMIAPDAGNIKWSYLPFENVSQIEIIKGASSVLYGSSALNGIINFRSAWPDPKPSTRIETETGIYDAPAERKWIWWDGVRMYSSAMISHTRQIKNSDIALSGKVTMDPGYRYLNNENSGRLSFNYRKRGIRHEGIDYGFRLNAGMARKRDFILWENALTGALKQDTSTAQLLKGSFFTFDPFFNHKGKGRISHELKMRVQSTVNDFEGNKRNNSSTLSLFGEYLLKYRLNENMDIYTGLAGSAAKINSVFYGDHASSNLAVYSQLDARIGERLKLSGGVRAEMNRLDNISDELVPVFRAGVNYRAAPYTFLRTSWGQGYRYPSIAERHAATTLGSIRIFPNPYIEPESGWNSEIGIRQGIRTGDWSGQADLACFYTRNKDMIEYLFGLYADPFTGQFSLGFQSGNTEYSRIYGSELEFLLRRSFKNAQMNFGGGYLYTLPVEFNPVSMKNTGKYLKYRRKHSLKFSTTFQSGSFDFGMDFFYNSKMLEIDDVFLDESTRETILPGFYNYWMNNRKAYVLADVYCGLKLGKIVKLSFVVKNIGNTEYMGRPGDIRPQRSYVLKLSGSI